MCFGRTARLLFAPFSAILWVHRHSRYLRRRVHGSSHISIHRHMAASRTGRIYVRQHISMGMSIQEWMHSFVYSGCDETLIRCMNDTQRPPKWHIDACIHAHLVTGTLRFPLTKHSLIRSLLRLKNPCFRLAWRPALAWLSAVGSWLPAPAWAGSRPSPGFRLSAPGSWLWLSFGFALAFLRLSFSYRLALL